MAKPTAYQESAEDRAEKTRQSEQEKTAVCSFTVANQRVAIAIQDDKLALKNRLVKHTRPYRPGSKLDSTGAEARVWNVKAIFNNSLDEPGLDQNIAQYPDNMNRVTDLCAVQATGDFVHPTDGKCRARIESAGRTIIHEEEDTGYIDLVFTEDNEEGVDALAFQRPAIKGAFRKMAEQTVFTAKEEGLWSADLSTLREFASELEGLLTFPGEYADAVVAQARATSLVLRSILTTAKTTRRENLARLQETPLRTIVNATRMLDVLGFALEEHNTGKPTTKPYYVKDTTTIFAIASDLKQDPDELMELNSQRIDDPFHVERGTIRVYTTGG